MKTIRRLIVIFISLFNLVVLGVSIEFLFKSDFLGFAIGIIMFLFISGVAYFILPKKNIKKKIPNDIKNTFEKHSKINESKLNESDNTHKNINTIEQKNESDKYVHNYYYLLDTFVDDITVIDFETTGFNSITDEIIQIGAVKYKSGEIVDCYEALVKPSIRISDHITSITGITNEMVKDALPINDHLIPLKDFLEEETLVAHNASFDMRFLTANLDKYGIQMGDIWVIDTLKHSRNLILDSKNHKLETLKKYLGLEAQSHNAIEDCKVTGSLYYYLKEINDNKPGMYKGKFFSEYVDVVKDLKRDNKNDEAINLLLNLVEAVEEKAKEDMLGPAPWYYEQLAILYRKTKQNDKEIEILNRFIQSCGKYGIPNGVGHKRLIERLEKLKK